MRLTLYEAPTRETRPGHNTANFVPYSLGRAEHFFQLVGLTSDVNWEAQETLLLVSLYFFGGGGGGRPCSLREVRGFFNVPCSQQSRCRRRGLRFIVLIRED